MKVFRCRRAFSSGPFIDKPGWQKINSSAQVMEFDYEDFLIGTEEEEDKSGESKKVLNDDVLEKMTRER